MSTKLDLETTTNFSVFIHQAVKDFDAFEIDEKVLYSRIKDYLADDVTRPSLSGKALQELDAWIVSDLKISKTAYGELVSDLYLSYVNFQTNPEKTISRKNFPNALLYVLRKIKDTMHPEYIAGRKPQITGLNLKSPNRT